MVKKVKRIILRLLKIMSKPEMLVLPGQLAFFFLLAIVPTVTLIAYGTSLFNVSYDFITNFVTKAFGGEIAELIVPIVQEISMTPAFFITLLVSFYTASTGASSIIITSNQLYNVKNTSFVKRKVKSIFMIFILIILLIFLLLIPAFGNKFIELVKYVNMNSSVTNFITIFIKVSQGPLSWFFTFFLIKIIYSMAPDAYIPSSYTTKGAIFTTVGFGLATGLYSFFVNNFAHYDILYGGLAHFVVLMIWLYLLAYVVTISLAINCEELARFQKKEQ